jgi:hypothetical protein
LISGRVIAILLGAMKQPAINAVPCPTCGHLCVPPDRQPRGNAVTRPLKGWRTVKELTEELRFPSEHACRAWLLRQGIASVRRGRVILVDRLDVDRAIRSA